MAARFADIGRGCSISLAQEVGTGKTKRPFLALERKSVDALWHTSPSSQFTIQVPAPHDVVVAYFGLMPLIKQQGNAVHGDPLNIFLYHGSQRQRVNLHNGNLAYLADGAELDPYFWHSCDTQRGSSGAPVLNQHWRVVDIHSKGVPDTDVNGELLQINGKTIAKPA